MSALLRRYAAEAEALTSAADAAAAAAELMRGAMLMPRCRVRRAPPSAAAA